MTKGNIRNHNKDFEFILENIATELHPFIYDHHKTWNLMSQVRKSNVQQIYNKALEVIAHEIQHHFKQEEDLILTRLKRYVNNQVVGPIAKLIDEHRSIEKKYHEVQKSYHQNPESLEFKKQINLLAYIIMKHIEKEDHYFYPLVSLILSQEEKAEISALFHILR
ncbi:hemerythrin domain-containing protein [Tepidibacillus fermentans]|uniref:Hemerythrin HHE cation binding domain-containing protein n=1 Tax=Tepidibacillus fermentans TaxID=1281767 RepID=A0A4R3KKW0_9BACI|nr:hemerythrin domain-containing protein [Tepidibacillus fermentans]TCS84541.1 hemerythrin HHE cation binding domain-containing protein [Tepidibacillus fermentans]